MFQELRRDAARYATLGGWYRHVGFWIGATYRFGTWAHALPLVLKVPMVFLYRIVKIPWVVVFNVFIPAGATGVRIGPGLCLIHARNILMGHGTVIGEDCLIFHEVTFGHGPVNGMPSVGSQVDIYVGARVLGGVSIGDRSMIGANCVVTKNVAPGSVVLSQPIRVLSRALLAPRAPQPSNGDAAP